MATPALENVDITLPTELQNLTIALDAGLDKFATSNTIVQSAALTATKHIFDLCRLNVTASNILG